MSAVRYGMPRVFTRTMDVSMVRDNVVAVEASYEGGASARRGRRVTLRCGQVTGYARRHD